jgi:hypothetical protein
MSKEDQVKIYYIYERNQEWILVKETKSKECTNDHQKSKIRGPRKNNRSNNTHKGHDEKNLNYYCS